MKDEIKEILTKLKIVSKTEEGGAYICDRGHCKLLLDYITNLQEQLHQASLDIQELTERDIECPSWCDKLTNLQEENEEIKLENEKLTQLWLNSQEKRRKAIKYLEQPYRDNFDYSKAQLLNILQGEDNE